jgi:uncharacterized coiled-coil protein SlyX
VLAMTTADKISLASAVGTGLAAIGTVIAVVYAAKSANASRDSAQTMREQWHRDRDDRARDDWRKRVSLLSLLRDECKAIDFSFRGGAQAHISMAAWERSRAEVALIDLELASTMRELEVRIARHNQSNQVNAETIWKPSQAELRAEFLAASPEERPSFQAKFEELQEQMIESVRADYERTRPLLDRARQQLDTLYEREKERPPSTLYNTSVS